MEVTVKKVEITLPEVDMALLKELAKKFGWNIGRKKSGIEKGLEDIKAGRVYKAKDMEDLNNIIDQKDKINIYGTFYPQNAEYTFSSAKDC